MTHLIDTLETPYYAVIFTSIRTNIDDGYSETDERMMELVAQQPGFLGFESARQEIGLTISYWSSLEAISAWKNNIEHGQARARASEWYRSYRVRVCRVEREYGF